MRYWWWLVGVWHGSVLDIDESNRDIKPSQVTRSVIPLEYTGGRFLLWGAYTGGASAPEATAMSVASYLHVSGTCKKH